MPCHEIILHVTYFPQQDDFQVVLFEDFKWKIDSGPEIQTHDPPTLMVKRLKVISVYGTWTNGL